VKHISCVFRTTCLQCSTVVIIFTLLLIHSFSPEYCLAKKVIFSTYNTQGNIENNYKKLENLFSLRSWVSKLSTNLEQGASNEFSHVFKAKSVGTKMFNRTKI